MHYSWRVFSCAALLLPTLALAQQPSTPPPACESQLSTLRSSITQTYQGLLTDNILPQGMNPAVSPEQALTVLNQRTRVLDRELLLETNQKKQEVANVTFLQEKTQRQEEQISKLQSELKAAQQAQASAQAKLAAKEKAEEKPAPPAPAGEGQGSK